MIQVPDDPRVNNKEKLFQFYIERMVKSGYHCFLSQEDMVLCLYRMFLLGLGTISVERPQISWRGRGGLLLSRLIDGGSYLKVMEEVRDITDLRLKMTVPIYQYQQLWLRDGVSGDPTWKRART